jgi:hypothetical protein
LVPYTITDRHEHCIGYLTCHYGCYDTFSPEIFSSPPFYEIEFKRKISDTSNAQRSYKSSCNKLAKYVQEKGWETLPEYDFEMPEEMEDLYIGLELLETKALRSGKKVPSVLNYQNTDATHSLPSNLPFLSQCICLYLLFSQNLADNQNVLNLNQTS